MQYSVIRLSACRELAGEVDRLHDRVWPRFVVEGHSPDGALGMWYPLLEEFADYQLVLVDGDGAVVGAGHTIPVIWDGTIEGLPGGWSGCVLEGFGIRGGKRRPTALAALGIAVAADRRGGGVAGAMLRGMKAIAAEEELDCLIAPVRPSWKERYPLAGMERYVEWRREGEEPFDPWIRAHWKMGAVGLGVVERSMTITGTVKEWEDWAEMRMPESGLYVVPGALVPVAIDRERDVGVYEEPNFWMRHTVR